MVAEGFALPMQKETGCIIVDVGGYRVVDPAELAGLARHQAFQCSGDSS
jgi:hypothetical protein